MRLKSSLSIASHSGFVAFDGGGAVEADTYRFTAKAPTLVPQPVEAETPSLERSSSDGLLQSATWEPASGLRARRVEGAVIIAICGYFVFGAASLLGWI
jgi:hypothetical protein